MFISRIWAVMEESIRCDLITEALRATQQYSSFGQTA